MLEAHSHQLMLLLLVVISCLMDPPWSVSSPLASTSLLVQLPLVAILSFLSLHPPLAFLEVMSALPVILLYNFPQTLSTKLPTETCSPQDRQDSPYQDRALLLLKEV